MQRYPDQIIILKVNGDGPYDTLTRTQVYTGRCRAFLDRNASYSGDGPVTNVYQVVIPDDKMPEIGENFVVAVRFHNNPSNVTWNIVGYVKDFARYDRVCKLIFEVVKDNTILEDIPGAAIMQGNKRKLAIFENEYVHIESPGLIGEDLVAEYESIYAYPKGNHTIELQYFGPNSDSGELRTLPDAITDTILVGYSSWVDKNTKNNYCFVLKHDEFENSDGGPFEPVINIVVKDNTDEIFSKKLKIIAK